MQAIAVLAHLVAEGQSHFMVVCPASVLVNWTREIEARSALRVMVLHGPDRHYAFADRKGPGRCRGDHVRRCAAFPHRAVGRSGCRWSTKRTP